MKFYEFGDKHNPVILLLPGTCCHWKANGFEVTYSKVFGGLLKLTYAEARINKGINSESKGWEE